MLGSIRLYGLYNWDKPIIFRGRVIDSVMTMIRQQLTLGDCF